MTEDLGRAFALALTRKNGSELKAILHPHVDFRAMTPRHFWESDDATDVVDNILLGKWLEPSDEVVGMISTDTASVGARQRVGYRFRVTNPDGTFIVEQQAYYESDADSITWLRIMCAGFVAEAP